MTLMEELNQSWQHLPQDAAALAEWLWLAEYGYKAGLFTINYVIETREWVADQAIALRNTNFSLEHRGTQ